MIVSTLYVSHPSALDHDTLPGHPECPDRIRAIECALESERFASLVRGSAPIAEPEVATLVHATPYVEAIIDAAPREGYVQIDGDTLMSPGTLEAALRAVGGAVHAVD